MKQILFTFFALTGWLLTANSQDYEIRGRVSSNGKSVEAATVRLLRTDSSTLRHTISEKDGQFILSEIKEGNYLISVQSVGTQLYYSQVITLNAAHPSYDLQTVALVETAKLKEVTVSSKKQFIEQKIDKTVINIDASPTSVGLSAMDLLEKTPGVTVDKDGNISLKGKQGVTVMIDGKPSYLSSQDLANFLKNTPSSTLDQIEIMTNPPAKYDAAGNAGIINFKTKKSKAKGFNTSITLGAGMGKYAKANESINLNYRTGKVNLFGNYSYSYNKGYQSLDITRNFRDTAGNIASVFSQHSDMFPSYQSHNFKTGLDFYASRKTTIGFAVNGHFNPGNFAVSNTTNIFNATDKLQNQTITSNNSDDQWTNYGANINLTTKLDTAGRELSANFDYIHYHSLSNQTFNNYFYDDKGNNSAADEIWRGYIPGTINIYSGKIDYTHPLKKNARIEAGVKSSYVETDNLADYDTLSNGVWVDYAGRTNHFLYKENINAAYVSASKQFNTKWSLQLGLRLENTISSGNQLTTGETFDRNYTQLFPTAYLSYTPNDKNQFGLNYGRRVQRPDYADLNPFYYFLDKYTYQVGNPYLRPQFSHNIELSHSYKGTVTTTLSYTAINDIIQQQLEQIDSTHTTYVRQTNLAQQRSITLSVSAGMPVTKWWRTNVYLQGSYNRYKGYINNGVIDVAGPSFNANMQNQFQLPKGWSMELSGWFNSKAIYGTIVGLPQGSADFAVVKNVMQDKGSIKVNFRDFLGLQSWSGYSKYQNLDVRLNNHWDSRVINVSFTYRFNKGQAGEQRRHNGGADEEQGRVKSGRG